MSDTPIPDTPEDELPELFKKNSPHMPKPKTGDLVWNGSSYTIWDAEVMDTRIKKTKHSRRVDHPGYDANDDEFGY